MRENTDLGNRVQRILDLVQKRTGLYFRRVQHAHAASAIGRAMQRAGTSDPRDYVSRLEGDLAALDDLVVELVVGETYFFRFPDQFRFLAETVLPDVRSRVAPPSLLRFWSAGCATGEEAYSLAIVLREAHLLDQSQILATDISKPALEHARRGVYQDWALRGDGRRRVAPYAESREGFHHLEAEIRKAVRFNEVNLALDSYPSLENGTGNQDAIFCRNVLIYLEPTAIPRVASCLFASLKPGGWLITAASDPLLDPHAPFEVVEAPGGVYYRRPLTFTESADPNLDWEKDGQSSRSPVDALGERDMQSDTHAIAKSARAALLAGQYEHAAELTAAGTIDEEVCCLHVKALANTDPELAQAACQRILVQHPLSVELHYLHALLLMEQRRDDQALTMIKRALFLDRTQAIAHLTLGTLLRRAGDMSGAFRAFRNARDLSRAEEPSRKVALADDETFGSVHQAAASQLASLDVSTEATR